MTDTPGWRRAFDAVDRTVSPRVESLVHSDEFAQTTALIARTRRLAGRRVNAVTASVWHLMNLPASTDVQRLRRQVGELDREIRRLSLQLDRDARRSD
jgi:hypothetical protein